LILLILLPLPLRLIFMLMPAYCCICNAVFSVFIPDSVNYHRDILKRAIIIGAEFSERQCVSGCLMLCDVLIPKHCCTNATIYPICLNP
jgi:hypothetical protein